MRQAPWIPPRPAERRCRDWIPCIASTRRVLTNVPIDQMAQPVDWPAGCAVTPACRTDCCADVNGTEQHSVRAPSEGRPVLLAAVRR
eukprot:scaffold28968_cov120-Isochrysis_galbana.AAC.4